MLHWVMAKNSGQKLIAPTRNLKGVVWAKWSRRRHKELLSKCSTDSASGIQTCRARRTPAPYRQQPLHVSRRETVCLHRSQMRVHKQKDVAAANEQCESWRIKPDVR